MRGWFTGVFREEPLEDLVTVTIVASLPGKIEDRLKIMQAYGNHHTRIFKDMSKFVAGYI